MYATFRLDESDADMSDWIAAAEEQREAILARIHELLYGSREAVLVRMRPAVAALKPDDGTEKVLKVTTDADLDALMAALDAALTVEKTEEGGELYFDADVLEEHGFNEFAPAYLEYGSESTPAVAFLEPAFQAVAAQQQEQDLGR